MKYIYISHVPFDSPYGSATSLRSHIKILHRCNQKDQVTLIFNVSPSQFLIYLFSAFKFSGVNFTLIPVCLILDKSYDYDDIFTLRKCFSFVMLCFLSPIFILLIIFYILLASPDILHLNSHILLKPLAPILNYLRFVLSGPKLICHVRDFPNALICNRKKIINKLNSLIFIDKAVLNSFSSFIPQTDCSKVIINNPFDSLSLKSHFKFPSIQVDNSLHVFKIAYVGALIPDKGVDFILNSLHLLHAPYNFHIFFIGSGPLESTVISISRIYPVSLIPLLPDLSSTDFYSQIDLLIRADKSFRTGRTVFEALYSGSNVLLPSYSSVIDDPELATFNRQIHTYTPRCESSFSLMLAKCMRLIPSCSSRSQHSNYDIYLKKLTQVYF